MIRSVLAIFLMLASGSALAAGEPVPEDRVDATVDPGPFTCPAGSTGTFRYLPGSGHGGTVRWTEQGGSADLSWDWPSYDAETKTYEIRLRARSSGEFIGPAHIGIKLPNVEGVGDAVVSTFVEPGIPDNDGVATISWSQEEELFVVIVASAGGGGSDGVICRIEAGSFSFGP